MPLAQVVEGSRGPEREQVEAQARVGVSFGVVIEVAHASVDKSLRVHINPNVDAAETSELEERRLRFGGAVDADVDRDGDLDILSVAGTASTPRTAIRIVHTFGDSVLHPSANAFVPGEKDPRGRRKEHPADRS